jgi:hypothetical protein
VAHFRFISLKDKLSHGTGAPSLHMLTKQDGGFYLVVKSDEKGNEKNAKGPLVEDQRAFH